MALILLLYGSRKAVRIIPALRTRQSIKPPSPLTRWLLASRRTPCPQLHSQPTPHLPRSPPPPHSPPHTPLPTSHPTPHLTPLSPPPRRAASRQQGAPPRTCSAACLACTAQGQRGWPGMRGSSLLPLTRKRVRSKEQAPALAHGPPGAGPPNQRVSRTLWPRALWPRALWPRALWPRAPWPRALWPRALWPRALWPRAL